MAEAGDNGNAEARALQPSAAGGSVMIPAGVGVQPARTAGKLRTALCPGSRAAAKLAESSRPDLLQAPGGALGSSLAADAGKEAQTACRAAAPLALPAQSAGMFSMTSGPGATHSVGFLLPPEHGQAEGNTAEGSMWQAFMDDADELQCDASPGNQQQQQPHSLWHATAPCAADEACLATSYD